MSTFVSRRAFLAAVGTALCLSLPVASLAAGTPEQVKACIKAASETKKSALDAAESSFKSGMATATATKKTELTTANVITNATAKKSAIKAANDKFTAASATLNAAKKATIQAANDKYKTATAECTKSGPAIAEPMQSVRGPVGPPTLPPFAGGIGLWNGTIDVTYWNSSLAITCIATYDGYHINCSDSANYNDSWFISVMGTTMTITGSFPSAAMNITGQAVGASTPQTFALTGKFGGGAVDVKGSASVGSNVLSIVFTTQDSFQQKVTVNLNRIAQCNSVQ